MGHWVKRLPSPCPLPEREGGWVRGLAVVVANRRPTEASSVEAKRHKMWGTLEWPE